MSTYTKQHYEDVANLIKGSWPEAVPEDVNEVMLFSLSNKFADLFAADNPDSVYCGYCGATRDHRLPCPERGVSGVEARSPHSFVYHKGFNREQFLTACGLKPKVDTAYSDYVAGKIAGEFE